MRIKNLSNNKEVSREIQLKFGLLVTSKGFDTAVAEMNLCLKTLLVELKQDSPRRKQISKFISFSRSQWEDLFWSYISSTDTRKKMIHIYNSQFPTRKVKPLKTKAF